MIIGDRLRSIREEKNLSQGDIQSRTGLLRCYVSRVENGHTVPSLETIEKFARALGTPVYRLFYDGEESPKLPKLSILRVQDPHEWGGDGKDRRNLDRLRSLLGRMEENDRKLLLHLAQKLHSQRGALKRNAKK
jgi:transcriptional regulator with XRE-family HTH domain